MRERTQFSLLGGVGLLYYWSLLRHVHEDNINLWKKLSKSDSWFLPLSLPTWASAMMSLRWGSEATLRHRIWINKCINSTEFWRSTQIVLKFSVVYGKYPSASCHIPATILVSMFKVKNQLVKKKKSKFFERNWYAPHQAEDEESNLFLQSMTSLLQGGMQKGECTEKVSQHSKHTQMWALSEYFTFCILGVIALYLLW